MMFMFSVLFAVLIEVSPQGPISSPAAAVEKVRALRESGNVSREETAVVRFAPGVYAIRETLRIGPADSNIRFEGAATGRTVFSGGVELGKFAAGADGLWHVPVPAGLAVEQLWVGGARARRAVSPNGDAAYHHIRYNLAESNACLVAEADTALLKQLAALPPDELTNAAVHVYYAWDTEWLRPNRVDPETGLLGFTAKAGRDFFLWKKWLPRFKVENFRAALDAPGEWFHDRAGGELLYLPRPGEDLATAVPFVPVCERLVAIAGDGERGAFVRNVTFDRIGFSGNAWHLAESLAPRQAARFIGAAVEVSEARAIRFERCRFDRTSTYALWFDRGSRESSVTDSLFTDLGAGGVRIGDFNRTTDVPADRFTGAITVDNNIIVGGGRLFPEAIGAQIVYAADCRLTHNEIADLYYTGVSVGWGWNYTPTQNRNNLIAYNHIHDLGKGVLCDMGGIYHLSEDFGTRIEGNVIHHVRSYRYTGSGGTGIYMDEASSGLTIVSNLVYDTRSGAAHQHYGRDNVFANNIFAYVMDGCSVVTRARVEEHRSFAFRNNIVAWNDGCSALKVGTTKKGIDFGGNLYWSATGKGRPVFDGQDFDAWMKDGGDAGSVFADPKFRDPAKGDFSVAADSPALTVGFVPWDIAKAGVRGAAWREKARSFVRRPDVDIPEPERYRGLPRWSCGFDDAAVGSSPKFPLRKHGDPIRVVSDATARGGRALMITDAKSKPGFDPYVTCTIPYAEKRLTFSYALKYAANGQFVQEWREYGEHCRNGVYATGLWIRANARAFTVAGCVPDGKGGYVEKDIALSTGGAGQWLRCRTEMRIRKGERVRCVVTLTNEKGETATTGEFFSFDGFSSPSWTAFFAWGGNDTDYLLDDIGYEADPVSAEPAEPSAAASAAEYAYPISPSVGGRENTEWSTFYSYHVRDKEKDLPRVLMLGDSITQSIRGFTEQKLRGKAVVSYWVTSYGVVRPEYMAQLEIVLRTHEYAVIHFNNGLHMSNATYDEYAAALEKALLLVRRLQPKAKIILATCTPLRDHPEKCYVDRLNEIGCSLAKKLELDAVTDLYALASGFERPTAWRDEVHFTPESQRKLAALAADKILKLVR